MPRTKLTRLTLRHPRLLTTLALFVVLVVVAGDPVAAVSDSAGDIYIGP